MAARREALPVSKETAEPVSDGFIISDEDA